MSIERLQSFIGHIRSGKLMEQGEIIRVVRQMNQLDRRVGAIGMLRGYIKPETACVITLAQITINKKFLEIAIDMGYLNDTQTKDILRLQSDELFSFSQAAVMAKVRSIQDMYGRLYEGISAGKPTRQRRG